MNRIALVTGGNRGIGLAVCRQLAEKGITVIMGSREVPAGKAAAAEKNISVDVQALDVTLPANIQKIKAYIEDTYGRLDILVNNAGILIDRGEGVVNADLDKVRQTMEVNLYGPIMLSQTFVPLMRKNSYGRIVNVSSRMGQLDGGLGSNTFAYRLSKVALNGMTAVLANEVHRDNILVNTMSPGWVATDMGGNSAPRTPDEGADTITYLATLPDDGPTGKFFAERREIAW